MPSLARICVFPIKSLDGVTLNAATLTAGGGLRYDRRFALVDAEGRFINGKRTAAVHRVRAEFDIEAETVRLGRQGEEKRETFSLVDERRRLEEWFSQFFGMTVTMIENRKGGFPDDTAAPGPTVISTQTLQTVADWFALPLDETRRRFRANLEIDATAPFWEDRLFGPDSRAVAFQIGDVSLLGTNPCARCVVPSRAAEGGEPTPQFVQRFVERRRAALPPWAATERFDHFYRLAINTQIQDGSSAAGAELRVGDAVRILESPEEPPL